jgi:hypothetical protein
MNRFTVSVIAAGVAATLSGTAAAATPTLDEVLKASGVSISGYLDITYTNFDTDGSGLYQAYTFEKNSFNANALDIAVSKLPASGAGAMVEVMAGEDPLFNKAKGWTTDNVDLLQAYVQYATGPVTAMAGKFTTLAGAEVAQQPSNTNLSRSLLYTLAIPVTHTGGRVSYAPSDTLKFMAGYSNGWDVVVENAASNCVGTNCADGKTVELGVSASPMKMLSLAGSYYTGEEVGTGDIGTRSLLDVVATVNLTDAMSIVANVDQGEQENGNADGSKAKWNGVAGYFNYKFSDALRVSLRGESFNDKDGFRTGTVQKLKEFTATVGYSPAASLELRGEVRQDKSDQDVFTKDGAVSAKQRLIAVEAVYKF